METLASKLEKATQRCQRENKLYSEGQFIKIYPFTTENISGYISNFPLANKSLLTIGSSADQAINANIFGCNNITILDLCPFTKEYFYLKKSALLNLSKEEFLRFFCYKNYNEYAINNKDVLNSKTFAKLESTLESLDEESLIFWTTLLEKFPALTVRTQLFSKDEENASLQEQMNPYLKSTKNYQQAQENIQKLTPNFIIGDIFATSISSNYDNIFLSNLANYTDFSHFKDLVKKNILPHLSTEGKLLLVYLYQVTKNTKYHNGMQEIYNLPKIFTEFSDVILEEFTGINGLQEDLPFLKDSAVTYQKK